MPIGSRHNFHNRAWLDEFVKFVDVFGFERGATPSPIGPIVDQIVTADRDAMNADFATDRAGPRNFTLLFGAVVFAFGDEF
jgi:hypothetical protein